MQITRIFNDEQGNSHFGTVQIEVSDGGPIGMLSKRFEVGQMLFRETPADYDFKWHPAPQRQLLFIIKGRCEFMVSSGETRQFGAGDVLLLEDTEGQGHCSKALFNEVRHSIFITLPDDVRF
ncbi:cupin domain-containing protein [Maribrevibacterium harenarium]|uniref:Cupin domain-containing protein n=1 Tax=Maribrevibacterium harenarium TaxID=2589817 RepID=A0A501WYL3_9GAMM|nr:AraC family ligand binding domain-containing protein [Maribrevibacterium harenarium]TPE53375.1 cupin domain-containing protein [Maribrevibacterium harenarium]